LTSESDRRIRGDRRKRAGFSIHHLFGNGKRRIIRRQEDKDRLFFVDQYSPWFFFVILTIVFLSLTDGLLTLRLLKHGAAETNPVMAYFLKRGPITFIVVKYSLTCLGLLIILIFRNIIIRKINVRAYKLFYFVIGLFAVVIAFECYLFYNVVP
jgi:hypothetical protein